MNHIIKLFLKFGSLENIQDLYENGTIYMNSIEYFRDIEYKELRGDGYEEATEGINSLSGTFKIPDEDKEFNYEKVQIKDSYDIVSGNIYSLYCLSTHGFKNSLDFKLDERNLKYGTHCLVIIDNYYFLNRIEKELKKNGYKYRHGFVEYYDKNNVSKVLTLFDKPREFEYQKEFRFFIHNEKIEPIKIKIGSLKGKSEICDSEEIMTLSFHNPEDLN